MPVYKFEVEPTSPCNIELASVPEFKAFLKEHGRSRRKRVMMTGSRRFESRAAITLALDRHVPAGAVLISGMAKGADTMAADWAIESEDDITLAGFPADWDRHGKAAGPLRNRVMLSCKPSLVVAFSDNIKRSTGTRDAMGMAMYLGIPVVQYNSAGQSRQLTPGQPKYDFDHPGVWDGTGEPPTGADRIFVAR